MKVFLCHSSLDKPLIREVARALPSGISVWLDEREIRTGQDISSAISEGIAGSGFLVAFLSDASLTSDWVRRELRIAIEKEERERSVCILPVLVRPVTVDLPEFLSKRKHAILATASERQVKALGKRIAEDVCYWVCHSDAFCRILRTHSNAATALGAELSSQVALIVETAVPKILEAFEAVLENSIVGRRKKEHPPLWLIQCAHAVAHHVRHKNPENALLGRAFAQPIHQAFLLGYYCAAVRRAIFSIRISPTDIEGAALSRVVDTVIGEVRNGVVPTGAVEANDAAQSILTPVLIDTFKTELAAAALRESAWLGGVYAVAEERICP